MAARPRSRRRRGPVMSTWSSSRAIRSAARRRPAPASAVRSVRPRRVGGDQGRAGAGAAGLGQARAALPDPQADAVAAEHLGEADVDALRGTAGGARSPARPSRTGAASTSATKKTTCGLPMETQPGVCQRRMRRPSCSSSARVSMLLGQRDVAPVQARRAHVDADQPLAGAAWRRSRPALVSITASSLPDGLHQQPADAARAVAAGADLLAVGVPEAHEGVDAFVAAARWRSAGRSRRRSPGRRWRAPRRRSARTARLRASTTTKSLPSPFIFRNGRLMARGHIGEDGPPCARDGLGRQARSGAARNAGMKACFARCAALRPRPSIAPRPGRRAADPFQWLEDIDAPGHGLGRGPERQVRQAAGGRPALRDLPRRGPRDLHRQGPHPDARASAPAGSTTSGRTPPTCTGSGATRRWPPTAPPARSGRRCWTSTRSPRPRARTGSGRAPTA